MFIFKNRTEQPGNTHNSVRALTVVIVCLKFLRENLSQKLLYMLSKYLLLSLLPGFFVLMLIQQPQNTVIALVYTTPS